MRAAVGVGLLLLLVACSTPTESAPAPSPAPSSSSRCPRRTRPPRTSRDPPTSEPLVFAVHVRRPPADLTRRQAGLLLDGGVRRWSQLGLPGGRLTVTRKPAALRSLPRDTVAVVPASKVGPEVRVLSVDGVDPLRDPDDYPIRAAGPDPGPVTTLTVVGDIMLGRRVGERAAAEGDPSYPLRPMQRRLRVGRHHRRQPREHALRRTAPPPRAATRSPPTRGSRRGCGRAGFDALSLANNHAGDYGETALVQTVDRLADAGLRAVRRRPRPGRRAAARGASSGTASLRLRRVQRHRRDPRGRPGPARARARSACRRAPGRSTGPSSTACSSDVRRLARRVDVVVVLPHWGDAVHRAPVADPGVRRAPARPAPAPTSSSAGTRTGCRAPRSSATALVVHSLGNFVFDMDFTPETNGGPGAGGDVLGRRAQGASTSCPTGSAPTSRRAWCRATRRTRMFANFWRFSEPRAATSQMTRPDPAELRRVDDGRHVVRRSGSRRTACCRAAPPGSPASRERLVVAGRVRRGSTVTPMPRRAADRTSAHPGRGRRAARGRDGDHARPRRPGRSTTIPRRWRRSAGDIAPRSAREPKWCWRSPAPRGSSPPKATNTTGRSPGAADQPARGLQQHRDARRVVLGPGRDRDGVEVRADQQVRRAGTEVTPGARRR